MENRKCPFCGEKMICVNAQDGEFTCTSCAEYANHDVLDFIENLKAENERLKGELQQSVTNYNKLRCLALHAMSEWLSALLWLAGTYLGKCLEPHIDVNLCTALRRKYNDAYRKTKKALMDGT
ncbi:MAG: TFIIB-type zinc ribbon-containing protein [Fibrobacter sp.]|nr:TFIIB-type zinc ribbon-containing protein [Fibrobacter sp.]